MYEVVFYEDARGYSEVQTFLDDLDQNSKNSKPTESFFKTVIHKINVVETLGTRSGKHHTKYLRDGIWEIKIKKTRILFFVGTDNKIVLLSVFIKKTKKTPKKEIIKAEKRKVDWEERYGYKKGD